jgi:hypothetical protein
MRAGRRVRAEARSVLAAMRGDPAHPRAERLAALTLGVLLLIGAIGTYLA